MPVTQKPTVRPRATEHIDEILSIVADIIEKGYGYVAKNGDVYFRVAYPRHNLVRARNQLTLLRDMDDRFSEMQAIVGERGRA